jgi:short-subunit dehydrogenase
MEATLITGASSGIGEAFARRLAERGDNLVLVARTEAKLKALCEELHRTHRVAARYIVADLTIRDAPLRIFEETEERALRITTLINNAGVGAIGDFATLDLDRQLRMLDLNVRALVALTHLYLRGMRERGHGTIINVASTAAFQAVPYMATYAATKAFVLSFSEALAEENRAFGVHVMALCPGATATDFFKVAGAEEALPFRALERPERVVETALRALNHHRVRAVHGRANRLLIELERFVPRSFVTRLIGRAMRPHYGKIERDESEKSLLDV